MPHGANKFNHWISHWNPCIASNFPSFMDKFDIVHNGKKGGTIKLYFSQKYNPIIFLERLQTCDLKLKFKKKKKTC